MRTTEEKNGFDRMAHAIKAAASTAAARLPENAAKDTSADQSKRSSSPAVIQTAIGPSRTVKPTSSLSQLFPALTFLRSAANSGSRPRVKAKPVASESPRSTQAFHQPSRPDVTKRQTAVMERLKQRGINCFACAGRIGIFTFYDLNILKSDDGG